jgi:hypothetical protein
MPQCPRSALVKPAILWWPLIMEVMASDEAPPRCCPAASCAGAHALEDVCHWIVNRERR